MKVCRALIHKNAPRAAHREYSVMDELVGAKNGGIKLAFSMELSGALLVLYLGLRRPDDEFVHSFMQL